MVELRDRRILIDGKPVLVFSGEVHYFRLKRSEWEDRVRKAKDMGCNAIASYIPWLIHEEVEGDFDLEGRLRIENDLGGFIDLCHSHGLWFVARPGPFIMAEMKNEGIPYWVYRKYPEAIPVGWDGAKATTKQLDILHPGYLEAVRKWYGKVMPLLASRLQTKGGPVIGVQLDNEVGMLSWVSNTPEFTENMLCDFARWIVETYGAEARERYPFDLNDPLPRRAAILSPKEEYGLAFHRDLGDFNRDRIRRYFAALRSYAEEEGVEGVPFIVNIHGSGGGRGLPFPIGIHHLFEAYTQAPGYLAGSDFYLGEFTRENAPDLYLINAFMAAVDRPENPLASMEFECGTGDYGETGAQRQSSESANAKVQLCVAQGNRLINYYLLAGGVNPPLRVKVSDGNDRVAFTGERHGFAAPINPEGLLDPTYFGLKETNRRLSDRQLELADADPEYDPVAIGFVPDYYKTDYHRPGPVRDLVDSLQDAREPLTTLARAMLWLGFRFPAIDFQRHSLDPKRTPVFAFAASRYLDEKDQQTLADYVESGGKLFIFGEFPDRTMEGQECRLLGDMLKIRPTGFRQAGSNQHLSLKGNHLLSFEPEVRVWRCQTFEARLDLMRVIGTDEVSGFEAELGKGSAVVLTGNYPCHVPLFEAVFERLGARPGLRHDYPWHGILSSTMRSPSGKRVLSLINLDMEPKTFRMSENGKPLFGGRTVKLGPKESRVLAM